MVRWWTVTDKALITVVLGWQNHPPQLFVWGWEAAQGVQRGPGTLLCLAGGRLQGRLA